MLSNSHECIFSSCHVLHCPTKLHLLSHSRTVTSWSLHSTFQQTGKTYFTHTHLAVVSVLNEHYKVVKHDQILFFSTQMPACLQQRDTDERTNKTTHSHKKQNNSQVTKQWINHTEMRTLTLGSKKAIRITVKFRHGN